MRFGLRLIGYLGKPQRLVELAKLGEDAGFDSVWFPHDSFMYNTWMLTTAVAQATSRIEIGSVGTNPYTTDPSEIATYFATADLLSKGRMILGLGVHTEKMVEWTGIDASDYIQRTQEAVQLIRALLRGEDVKHDGACFRWQEECYLRFETQRQNPPIYVAAFGPEYLELSGRIGDGSLPMLTPPASSQYMVSTINAGLAHNTHIPRDEYVISGCAWLSLSRRRQAAAEIMKEMVSYFGPYLEEPALNAIGLSVAQMQPLRAAVKENNYDLARSLVTDDMLELGITGTPQDVIEQIEMLRSAGVHEVNLGGPLGPDPEEAIALMGEVVIPYFR